MLELAPHAFDVVFRLAAATGLAALALGLWRERGARLGLVASLAAERRNVAELQRDFAAVLRAARIVDERIDRYSFSQKSLAAKLDYIDNHADHGFGADQIQGLITKGLSTDEIARICRLTPGEQQLVERFAEHRRAA